MNPEVIERGVRWSAPLPTGEEALFYFNDIRRERTGVHALVAIALGGGPETILAHDTFNIGRQEERSRLVKQAHKQLGQVHQDAWKIETMQHDLDTCALSTPAIWEERRIAIVEYDPDDEPEPLRFALEPYVLVGGGTIFFGPPGSSKSYLLQAIAVTVATGQSKLWPVSFGPVLYINLERDGNSMHRREKAVMHALGIEGRSNVSYLHARGMSLVAVERHAKRWLRGTGYGGVVLDSVSRGGLGSLNEDETANRFIDVMNGLNTSWWAAIGHTPRASSDHLFGSQMFDAGEDVGVSVKAQKQVGMVGIALHIAKANDIGQYPDQYLAFEFDAPDQPVSRIRTATVAEFPELSGESKADDYDRLKAYVLSVGKTSATMASAELGIDRSKIARWFSHEPFREVGKDKQSVLYAVSTNTHRNVEETY